MHISLFSSDFVELYHLNDLVDNQGFIHMEIRGRMHGLPQSGRLAHKELVAYLAPYGYSSVKFISSL